MDFGPKDIARAVGVVVVIAIFVYLYYDRRNTLKRKLDGRDQNEVLGQQVSVIKRQMDAMENVMRTYLALFADGRECGIGELYETLEPPYTAMADVAENTELIEELFDADILKMAGSCQSFFNDFGFQSYFFDMLGAFGADPAPSYAEKAVKPAYQAFARTFETEETVALKPEKYAKLMVLADDFADTKQRLFVRLEQKVSQSR